MRYTAVETVIIEDPSDPEQHLVINASDFDPKVHVKWEGPINEPPPVPVAQRFDMLKILPRQLYEAVLKAGISTPMGVICASEDQLMKIKGMGRKLAQALKDHAAAVIAEQAEIDARVAAEIEARVQAELADSNGAAEKNPEPAPGASAEPK